MAYVGRGLDKISNIEVLDAITFTDSAGPYNVLQNGVAFVPIASNTLVISVDGIIQAPDTYTISAATITFTASMPSTSTMNFMYQIFYRYQIGRDAANRCITKNCCSTLVTWLLMTNSN